MFGVVDCSIVHISNVWISSRPSPPSALPTSPIQSWYNEWSFEMCEDDDYAHVTTFLQINITQAAYYMDF